MEISPQLVSFPSAGGVLRGYLHAPDPAEPGPAVVWSHGSERDPGPTEALARFYASRGCALFAPHRRGHGSSPGSYPITDLHERLTGAGAGGVSRRELAESVIALHREYLEDTAAAVGWIARQPGVDSRRVIVSGVSHGAIQALLAAGAGLGVEAAIAFAPAAMAWEGNPKLHAWLLDAVRRAPAPIFLAQAANDYSLGPSEVLGAELRAKGPPNEARVYPPYGSGPAAGHGAFACEATGVWGADVAAFLDHVSPAWARAGPGLS